MRVSWKNGFKEIVSQDVFYILNTYMIKKMIYCNLLNEYLRFVHFEQGHYFKLPFKEIFKGKSIQII